MIWKNLLDWIKLPPKLLFALAAICGVLVFAPPSVLEHLGLKSVVETLRGWIGFGFIAFSILLFAHFAAWLFGFISPRIKDWHIIRLHRKRLHQLDAVEKQLLAEFIAKDTRTLRLDSVRLRALLWFEMSEVYFAWSNRKDKAPLSVSELNKRVERDLARMSGFRLLDENEDSLNRAALWILLRLSVSDNKLSQAEQSVLRRMFGDTLAEQAIGHLRKSGTEGVNAKMRSVLRAIRPLPADARSRLYETAEECASLVEGDLPPRLAVLGEICESLGLQREPKITEQAD